MTSRRIVELFLSMIFKVRIHTDQMRALSRLSVIRYIPLPLARMSP